MSESEMNNEPEIEPYKLSEIFSIIPEFDGDQIFLQTFLNACDCAFGMSTGNQKLLLVIHIKNKLRGRAAQLINSRNPSSYFEIKQLLNSHFGDTRDLSSLIQDLQRVKQLPNESPLIFLNRVQVLNAKMHANIQKSSLTNNEKQAQICLIESMALNTLLTGLDPRIGHIIRASNPKDIIEAQIRIRRELQLSYFENQKQNKLNTVRFSQNQPIKRPNLSPPKCTSCGRLGHLSRDDLCRARQMNNNNYTHFNPQNTNNFQRQPQHFTQSQNVNQRPYFQQNNSNNQQRPSVIQQRPSVIQRNPNFNNNNHRAHFINQDYSTYDYSNEYSNNYSDNYSNNYSENYSDNFSNDYFYDNSPNSQDYSNYYSEQEYDDYQNYDNAQQQNFHLRSDQNHPPDTQKTDTNEIQTNFQTLNLNHTNQSQEQKFT